MKSKNPKIYLGQEKMNYAKFQPSNSLIFELLPTVEDKVEQHKQQQSNDSNNTQNNSSNSSPGT
jgi:hypothetical protein